MKKLIVLVGLMLASVTANAQFGLGTIKSKTVTETLQEANEFDLHNYLDAFTRDMQKNGIAMDSILKAQVKVDVNFARIGNGGFGIVLGQAEGMFKDTIVNIKINPYVWKSQSQVERSMLIYHEAAHDFFMLHHNTCEVMSHSTDIMDSEYDWSDFIRMRDEMVLDVKAGVTTLDSDKTPFEQVPIAKL